MEFYYIKYFIILYIMHSFIQVTSGCGNITSFFIMHSNQAVEVLAGWACFHSRDEILKFPCKCSRSLSCVAVVRNVRLPSELTFRTDCL